MLSEYEMDPRIQERKEEYRFDLEALTERRDALVEAAKEEKLHLEKKPKELIIQSINAHVEFLKQEIKKIEAEIHNILVKKGNEIKEVLLFEKGIGEQTAAILIASLPELGKLDNREISKLVGLARWLTKAEKCNLEDILEEAFFMSEYNESFRVKVVEFLGRGHTQREAAEIFGVSMKSIYTWNKMAKQGKRLKFKKVPRSPHRVNYEKLLEYLKEHPDAYLREISAHFSVAITTIWTALKRLGVKYKKTQNISRSRSQKTGRIYRISKESWKR